MKRVIWMLYGIVLCAALGIAERSIVRKKQLTYALRRERPKLRR